MEFVVGSVEDVRSRYALSIGAELGAPFVDDLRAASYPRVDREAFRLVADRFEAAYLDRFRSYYALPPGHAALALSQAVRALDRLCVSIDAWERIDHGDLSTDARPGRAQWLAWLTYEPERSRRP